MLPPLARATRLGKTAAHVLRRPHYSGYIVPRNPHSVLRTCASYLETDRFVGVSSDRTWRAAGNQVSGKLQGSKSRNLEESLRASKDATGSRAATG